MIIKALAIALASAASSVLLAIVILPFFGATLGTLGLLMCILCPLIIAWPATSYMIWQNNRLSLAHAELAIAHQRLMEKARRDDMTGMLNRESFFGSLEKTRRKTDAGVLLIIDADHFKSINDRFGHLVGDEALRHIASALHEAIRAGDMLGRIGGEEFTVFLAGACEKEAVLIAERIRQQVEKIEFQAEDNQIVPLTVSIGGAIWQPGATISDMMRIADQRLYEAKKRGRNRVIFDPNKKNAKAA
ncbi:GGDEF domain-containing protein [Aquamicrobium segne]|uniref:diguanylate cyclase n=1 Tax=Aquamicrobium segne TaxID=469547 RepID=A0ABW0GSD9_9HYPH